MTDISNIYKLSEEELEKVKQNLWAEAMPNAEKVANNLKGYISNSKTPFVLALEAEFGMGKTFFSTRFVEFLKQKHNKIDAIYFSAWEDDYLQDPFLAFSKAILSNFNKRTRGITALKNLFKKTASSLTISAGINYRLVSASANCDIGKLIDSFTQDDIIKSFKEKFKKYIIKNYKGKLVLIVDELDRCRPDFAIRTFETIKHFFDIEGLFVIIPINNKAIINAVKSLYNINNDNDCEAYLKKFINDYYEIPKPDYSEFIKQKFNETTLSNEIRRKIITTEKEHFSSLELLQQKTIYYSSQYNLSLRELNDIVVLIKHFLRIQNLENKARVEPLVYSIFCKFLEKNQKNLRSIPELAAKNELRFVLSEILSVESKINKLVMYQREYATKIYPDFHEQLLLFRKAKNLKEINNFLIDFIETCEPLSVCTFNSAISSSPDIFKPLQKQIENICYKHGYVSDKVDLEDIEKETVLYKYDKFFNEYEIITDDKNIQFIGNL